MFSAGDGSQLGRAERRAIVGHAVQPHTDLAIARLGERIFVGIRGGGRVRLTRAEARRLAGELIELADPTPDANRPAAAGDASRLEDPHDG